MKRVRQFFLAIRARLTRKDREFIKKNLNNSEKKLFTAMNIFDQRHALNTAYMAMQLAKQDKNCDEELLIKAALLHDIGRDAKYILLLDKVFFVLVQAVSPRLCRYLAKKDGEGIIGSRRKALYICLYHAAIGARKLEYINEYKLAKLLALHHQKQQATDSRELTLLRQADKSN